MRRAIIGLYGESLYPFSTATTIACGEKRHTVGFSKKGRLFLGRHSADDDRDAAVRAQLGAPDIYGCYAIKPIVRAYAEVWRETMAADERWAGNNRLERYQQLKDAGARIGSAFANLLTNMDKQIKGKHHVRDRCSRRYQGKDTHYDAKYRHSIIYRMHLPFKQRFADYMTSRLSDIEQRIYADLVESKRYKRFTEVYGYKDQPLPQYRHVAYRAPASKVYFSLIVSDDAEERDRAMSSTEGGWGSYRLRIVVTVPTHWYKRVYKNGLAFVDKRIILELLQVMPDKNGKPAYVASIATQPSKRSYNVVAKRGVVEFDGTDYHITKWLRAPRKSRTTH